jgi:pyrimidine operon attenuation protein/uracil phosphoribosyltransferase
MGPELRLKSQLMSEAEINRATLRMAHEIVEQNDGADSLALVGIYTRGVPLAEHLADHIERIEGIRPLVGRLDITLYRDDLSEIAVQPIVRRTDISFDIHRMNVVLCDDVIYTGRTSRAALDALCDLGRPARIQLAVLFDRGHRELPIQTNFVGKSIPTSRKEVIKVKFMSVDGQECVELLERV